jgi:hypothetical protein
MALPQSPAQRTRPGTVAAAVYALYALAVLGAVSVILQLSVVGPSVDAARDYLKDDPQKDTIVASIQIVSYVIAAIGLLFAIGWVILAVFVNRGRNAARITAWVLLGLSLCCGLGGLAGNALGSSMAGNNPGGVDQAELNRRIADAQPDWYPAVGLVGGILSVLLVLAVIILLALPASNDFFRKPAAAVPWEPPVPGAPLAPGGPSGVVPPAPGHEPSGYGPSGYEPPAPPRPGE